MYSLLPSISIFHDFTDQELADIEQIGKEEHFESQIDIISEGETSDDFFIILKGKLEVLKFENEGEMRGSQFRLTTLSEGDVCGEVSFIDRFPRSSTVRTLEPTTVLRISKERLSTATHHDEIKKKLTYNITKTSIKRLRDSNQQYVDTLQSKLDLMKKRHQFGMFFIGIFISFSVLAISQFIFKLFHFNFRSDIATITNLFLVFFPAFYFIWKFKIPWRDFGLTWNKTVISALEGILAGVALGFSSILIDSAYSGTPFKEQIQVIKENTPLSWLLIYPFLAFIQEFVARGLMQSSIQKFLNDKKGLYTVFINSVFFAGMHIFRGWQFVIGAFVASALMGLFYLYRPNLIGVTLLHTVVGFVFIPISEKY